MIEKIKQKVKELESYIIDIRRHLHQNPELSGQEFNTAEYIYEKLKQAGLQAEIINTPDCLGVVGNLIVNPEKETIAFRADMDALPLMDKKEKIYSSKNPGVMHACGHDFNMTSVLGTAFVLAGLKNELDVNIRFIFQSSEETPEGGAAALIKAGVMKGVSSIFTVHALPSLQSGKIGIRYGATTAAIDAFNLIVHGKGGHSARPHQAVDAIYVASQIINSLYLSVQRSFDPLSPVVFSVGKIHGGTAPNIIAEKCEIEGTVRTFSHLIRDELQNLIRKKAFSVAKSYDASVEVNWHYGSPAVINDKCLFELTKDSAKNIIGSENIYEIENPSMGAEDFSRFLTHAPGMLIRVGTGGEECDYPLHNSMFDIDESSFAVSVSLLSAIAVNFQNNVCDSREYIKNIVV